MAHINVPMPGVTRASVKSFKIKNFTGGICFSENNEPPSYPAFPMIRNLMGTSSGILKTREGIVEDFSSMPSSGTFYSRSSTSFFGSIIAHIGTSLYSINSSEQKAFYTEMPDRGSFAVEINSKLYFFCQNLKVYIVDKDYNVTIYMPPPVPYITEAGNFLGTYKLCDLPDTFMIGEISVGYKSMGAGCTDYILPFMPDTEFPIRFYNASDGTELTNLEFTLSGSRVKLPEKVMIAINITFTPIKGSECRRIDRIFGCRTATCYGGEGGSGNRVFFTGNPEYPGYYFYSDLLDPLNVNLLSYDIIGNGSENINALVRWRKDLIAFCDTRTERITYSFDIDNGAYFKSSEISSKIGCDMPGSIQIIDNRPVFASSGKGIYIIVSSDYTDELSIRSISANVNGKSHYIAFLESSKNAKTYCSADYDRTYRLFIDGYAYVWDYGNTPYISGDDPSYAEKSLSWYYFELPHITDAIELEGNLYCRCKEGDIYRYGRLNRKVQSDFGKKINCYLNTGKLDFDMPEAKKMLCEIYIIAITPGDEISLVLSGDGRQLSSMTIPVDTDEVSLGGNFDVGQKRLRVILHKQEAVGFTLELSATGFMGIKAVSFKFIGEGIYCR